eukprot:TRINITY_DN92139_c0_g1_i1.p1 TRINITY_DN92139_c0_g1~~TRINITY_DN92139_c0_g1_i1.p1  ORF type:complete len:190 (+),score=39.56 TRINITY_DN92139_c0_g1_i1:73-642(+)
MVVMSGLDRAVYTTCAAEHSRGMLDAASSSDSHHLLPARRLSEQRHSSTSFFFDKCKLPGMSMTPECLKKKMMSQVPGMGGGHAVHKHHHGHPAMPKMPGLGGGGGVAAAAAGHGGGKFGFYSEADTDDGAWQGEKTASSGIAGGSNESRALNFPRRRLRAAHEASVAMVAVSQEPQQTEMGGPFGSFL